MKCCLWCYYFYKKNGVPWCAKHEYSTSESGGQSCSYFKDKR